MLNREGLSWDEWQAAAWPSGNRSYVLALAERMLVGGDNRPGYLMHQAWELGEDPTEWRALLEAEEAHDNKRLIQVTDAARGADRFTLLAACLSCCGRHVMTAAELHAWRAPRGEHLLLIDLFWAFSESSADRYWRETVPTRLESWLVDRPLLELEEPSWYRPRISFSYGAGQSVPEVEVRAEVALEELRRLVDGPRPRRLFKRRRRADIDKEIQLVRDLWGAKGGTVLNDPSSLRLCTRFESWREVVEALGELGDILSVSTNSDGGDL